MSRFASIESSTTTSKKKSGKFSTILCVVLIIVGLVGMLYPLSATLVNNRYMSKVNEETEQKVSAIHDVERDQLWADMEAFNERLKQSPVSVTGIGGGVGHDRYDDYLNAGKADDIETLSHIVIPSIDVSLPVYRGSTEESLRKGAGHLFGTTLPVGGEGSNTAISAHTGMVNASMFDALPKLKSGDAIYLTTLGRKLKYEMVSSEVVPPTELDAISSPGTEGDHLYLITCTPYGLNTDRLVVKAVRVELESPPPNLTEISNTLSGWQWWMTVSVLCAVFVLFLSFYPRIRRAVRKRKKNRSADSNV